MGIMSSILIRARSLIRTDDSVKFRRFVSNSISEFGVASQTFSDWVIVAANVQPGIVSSFGGSNIEMKDYKEMGLDWSRRYITVWIKDKGLQPCVDKNGADEILYNGMEFTVIQVENWDRFNNWQRIYCVEKK